MTVNYSGTQSFIKTFFQGCCECAGRSAALHLQRVSCVCHFLAHLCHCGRQYFHGQISAVSFIKTDRQTDKGKDRQITDRQTDKQTDRKTMTDR